MAVIASRLERVRFFRRLDNCSGVYVLFNRRKCDVIPASTLDLPVLLRGLVRHNAAHYTPSGGIETPQMMVKVIRGLGREKKGLFSSL